MFFFFFGLSSLFFIPKNLFSINKKYYATAILAGISNFLRFYTGGIRGALRIAEKKNIKNYLKAFKRYQKLVKAI